MKIVIPSYGRSQTMRTHLFLEGFDYQIVVHNDEEKREYLKNPTIPPERLIVSNAPRGISKIRQWIVDNLIADGEWYYAFDDNIKYFTALPEPYYSCPRLPTKEKPAEFRNLFHKQVDFKTIDELVKKDIERADRLGITNIGFATLHSEYYREVKYRYCGYVTSKACVRKKNGVDFDPNVLAMDDYAYGAECLYRDGRVLINNWIYPTAGHYEDGGIGKYEERKEKKRKDCVYLMNKYPGLFRYNPKRTADALSELKFRITSQKQVNEWRRKIKELRVRNMR